MSRGLYFRHRPDRGGCDDGAAHDALQANAEIPGTPTMLVRLIRQRLDRNESLERALLR